MECRDLYEGERITSSSVSAIGSNAQRNSSVLRVFSASLLVHLSCFYLFMSKSLVATCANRTGHNHEIISTMSAVKYFIEQRLLQLIDLPRNDSNRRRLSYECLMRHDKKHLLSLWTNTVFVEN